MATRKVVASPGWRSLQCRPVSAPASQLQNHLTSRHQSTTAQTTIRPQLVPNAPNSEALQMSLTRLLRSSGMGGRWTLANDGQAMERTFKFKTFAKTWDFMTAVSLQCKLKNHHPEWSNVFNTTFIRWTTHNPKGLTSIDGELAAICDALARDFGELEEESQTCSLPGLANQVSTSAADCCTPKDEEPPKFAQVLH